MNGTLHALLERAGVPVLVDEPLARHTSIGIGGPVPALLTPRSVAELAVAIRALGEFGMPWRVLGAGSNLLADDTGLDFAAIATRGLAREPVIDGSRVLADAGIFLPRLVHLCAGRGLSGLEWGIGVPGSVGGALHMNAGAWGSDMSRVVASVTVVSTTDGEVVERPFEPVFAYRRAGVAPSQIVTTVAFQLEQAQPATTLATIESYLAERRRTQPTAARSAGCAFKNPPGNLAGRLIDTAGLKGLERGPVMVSPLHANFVINRGGAHAAEMLALIDEVRARVLERHGIKLEDEIVRWHGGQHG